MGALFYVLDAAGWDAAGCVPTLRYGVQTAGRRRLRPYSGRAQGHGRAQGPPLLACARLGHKELQGRLGLNAPGLQGEIQLKKSVVELFEFAGPEVAHLIEGLADHERFLAEGGGNIVGAAALLRL